MKIPVIANVDILILGGSSGAVELALEAKRGGKTLFCATDFTYFGDDICGGGRFAEAYLPQRTTPLFDRIFKGKDWPLPLTIKRTLEQELVKGDIPYLFMTYPYALLKDDKGAAAGAVLVNRSGFFAVRASAVVDAGENAGLARCSGAEFTPFEPGKRSFELRTMVPDDKGKFLFEGRRYAYRSLVKEYELNEYNPLVWAGIHADMKEEAFDPQQVFSADRVLCDPVDRVVKTAPGLHVLGPCSEGKVPLPGDLMHRGGQLGRELARTMTNHGSPENTVKPYQFEEPISDSSLLRRDSFFRYTHEEKSLELDLNRSSLIGEWDVLIAGGGTAGAPAAIGAGRSGAKVLMVEYLSNLGGVSTEGKITKYYHGNRVGFTSEIDRGTAAMGPVGQWKADQGVWDQQWKMAWYLKEVNKAGVCYLPGSITVAAGVIKDETPSVKGALIATPWGCFYASAKAAVDATGSADLSAAAGAETVEITGEHAAVQGTGLPPLRPGETYRNTDYTFVDDGDATDVTRIFTQAREKFRSWFDLAQIVDSRQRRQIVGDTCLDPVDFLAGRTYGDTIFTGESNFDTHGFTIHPLFTAKAPDKRVLRADVPLGCLLPRGLEGILTTGLGVSCHRDALPVIRMQPDVQNQGYAAGYIAAQSAQTLRAVRDLDIRKIQAHLVDIDILEKRILQEEDNFPLSDRRIHEAVSLEIETHLGLAVIFSNRERALPILRQVYSSRVRNGSPLDYALVMALCGDDTGEVTLAEYARGHDWDKGWHYTGMGQFGFSLSRLDSVLIALGLCGGRDAKRALKEKIQSLRPELEFSHFRALALALEKTPMEEACEPLTRCLLARGVKGNSRSELKATLAEIIDDTVDTSERNQELREIFIARALLACGDPQGLARKVLEGYAGDLHGHYARHARGLLNRSSRDRPWASGITVSYPRP